MKEIAEREGISEEKLKRRVKSGSVVITKNSERNIEPIAIGEGTRVKVNANIGTSTDTSGIENELEKARVAIEAGTHTLMDLSVGGDIDSTRREILKKTDIPLGTVPIYQAFIEKKVDMTADSILDVIEKHCKDGVDFLTLHCGITRDIVERVGERLIPITSRGGSFIAAWTIRNQQENPLYSEFDRILEIVKDYDVVISLGDALRPASIHDASDWCQFQELLNLGRLTKRAREADVPIIIEGPGHVPLDQIEMNMKLGKKLCDNAPFYVLGPLVTDIALGYDHISGAIGGALAAIHGADFLCYVTPSEHLGLPTVEDVREGVIASKIAAHAADIVRLGDTTRDDELSRARRELDWDRIFELCIDGRVKEKHKDLCGKKVCTMCGKYCALKILEEYLEE
ncbi:MAG: phosphomethylpyrimidine synthase ThiC [Candidatus Altiarchaeales archaeon]|nr:phosphomethylpyrimidine synthase ThiC [Candidatus Altiarchaeota archaeon]MBU4340982.1 phosphomethylpyrimidine synthase ThiC [Candidatus Altiarchaeota archaeon]MBU4406201.1 phosphomethylpyrimidine synthase ThiC [Candidatus Altiarchaeota archaeon]MBU4437753.1 phosphomethylpyrimidine synthase ThiC [Candidatus Altiarchaeota archaeon]MCG2782286.1 phosphomethylpyrimidine synthase ThiC [Candidatus Altiarchaeales archaeon]